jgi:hypothetical protein
VVQECYLQRETPFAEDKGFGVINMVDPKTTSEPIDFSEIDRRIKGEQLELLAKAIFEKMGIACSWSGRGADQGRDLVISEILTGSISKHRIRWLVSCKDYFIAGNSVGCDDVGAILERVEQHKCDGFFLVTTTVPSSGLVSMLEALDKKNGGKILTDYWDISSLKRILINSEYHEVVKTFLPKSYERLIKLGPSELHLDALMSGLTSEAAERLRLFYNELSLQKAQLDGIEIWPFDYAQSAIIDVIISSLDTKDVETAVKQSRLLEFDAFDAMINELHRYGHEMLYEYLFAIGCSGKGDIMSQSAFEFISSLFEPSNEDQIALASHLSEESLREIYEAEIALFVEDKIINGHVDSVYSELDSLSSHTQIVGIWVKTLEFDSVDEHTIHFKGKMSIEVELWFGGSSDGSSSSDSFPGEFEGYFDPYGMYLEKASVNTSSYYR